MFGSKRASENLWECSGLMAAETRDGTGLMRTQGRPRAQKIEKATLRYAIFLKKALKSRVLIFSDYINLGYHWP
jgi:hypothetical protein